MKFLPFFLLFVAFCFSVIPAQAADPMEGSGLPVPRFVSLKSENAYIRTGPSMDYPIKWIYKRAGLPVEIVQEYDAWRKIKDPSGDTGWVHKLLLSGKRSAVVKGQDPVKAYIDEDRSRLLALLEPGTLVRIEECESDACYIDFSVYKGWAEKKFLWGVYPKEIFN